MSDEKALTALDRIAKNEAWRAAFIRGLIAMEPSLATPGVDVREDLTGPLVDALYDDDQVVRKTLSNGVTFEFLYRSKIARDFVMSVPETPDHAWEPQTSRILVNLAKAAKQVVVGGAYFGDHAVLIAKEVAKRGGTVHAFEPNNQQRAMLTRNAEINGLTNIVPRPEGLWDNSTTNLKLVGYDSFASAETAEAGGDDVFKTVTIADYLQAAGVDQLDLIVIDIEGAELAALKGAGKFLKGDKAPNILFEVHKHYVDWDQGGLENTDLIKFLTGHGYTIYALRDFNSNYDLAGKPIELIPLGSIHLEGPPHGFNMVAVKDPSVFSGPDYAIVKDVSPKLLRHKDPALHHPIGGL